MSKGATQERLAGLVEFAREVRLNEARARCPVCQLPEELQEELRDAVRRGIERRFQLMYLQKEGYTITSAELTTHRNGGHDG